MEIVNILFKAFAIAFAFIYFFYTLIMTKQTQGLNDTLRVRRGYVLTLISLIQTVLSLILVVYAIIFI